MKHTIIMTLLSTLLLFSFSKSNGQSGNAKPKAKQTTPNNEQKKSIDEEDLKPIESKGGKPVIAVYHFTTAYGYSYDYAMSAGTAVEAGFVRSGRFTVVERNRFGIIKEEEKFKEANTQDIVSKASKLGAKTLITGHIIAVTTGMDNDRILPIRTNIAQISLAFKIIDVETGQIQKSETILGKGRGTTQTEAMQSAYEDIDRLARAYVAEFLPQRFEFASEVQVDKKGRLQQFKIWGGSDQGIKVGDIIEIYEVTYVESPVTKKRIEEKKLRGTAKVKEVNSTESSTCELVNSGSTGEQLRNDIKNKPQSIVFEYKGMVKKKGIF